LNFDYQKNVDYIPEGTHTDHDNKPSQISDILFTIKSFLNTKKFITIVAVCITILFITALITVVLCRFLYTHNDNTPHTPSPGIIYNLSSDNSYYEVVGYEGSATKVYIAAEYNNLPVKAICDNAFYNLESITSIIIPDSVIHIGKQAFYWCENLKSITIPSSVLSIDSYAFYQCDSLTNVVIPDSVSNIGEEVFAHCDKLYSVVIGSNVSNMGNSVFKGCRDLQEITIKKGVTCLGKYTFSYCEELKNITIPDSVTIVGESLFRDCKKLQSVVIGNNVTQIDDYAFYGCKNLTSIVIPNSVTRIGDWVFYPTNLKDVYYTGSAYEWSKISIGNHNYTPENATLHYNYIPINQ